QRAAPASITIVVADNKASEFKATSGESSTGARWRIISDTEWNAEQAKQAEALGDETRQGPTLDDIDGLFEEADADLDLQTEFTRNLWKAHDPATRPSPTLIALLTLGSGAAAIARVFYPWLALPILALSIYQQYRHDLLLLHSKHREHALSSSSFYLKVLSAA